MEPFAWEFGHPEPEIGHPERSRGIPMRNLKGNIAGSLDCARDEGVNGVVRGCVPLRHFRKRKKATVLVENNGPAHMRDAEVRSGLAVAGTTMWQEGPLTPTGNGW